MSTVKANEICSATANEGRAKIILKSDPRWWYFSLVLAAIQHIHLSFRNKIFEDATGRKDPISVSAPKDESRDFPRKIDRSGLERVKFFWTEEQKMVMSDPANTRLIIKGRPGVGKTLLLKNKVMEIADSTSKDNSVLFIVGTVSYFFSRDFKIFLKKTNFTRLANLYFSNRLNNCYFFWKMQK